VTRWIPKLSAVRNGSRWQPPASADLHALLNEAEYFGLQPMVERLAPPPPPLPAVQFHNMQRVGSVLSLVDPTEFGEATFRPADSEAFAFGVQLLADGQLVFLSLFETRSKKRWIFLSDRGSLRSPPIGGDVALAFETGPHADHRPEAADERWVAKAGDVIKLHFVRGPPTRLFVTHNGVPSDEHSTLGDSSDPPIRHREGLIPADGDFVVIVGLKERQYILPNFNEGMNLQDLDDAYTVDLGGIQTVPDAARAGVEHGIAFASGKVDVGVVSITDWQSESE
jgi:hypothetical protein